MGHNYNFSAVPERNNTWKMVCLAIELELSDKQFAELIRAEEPC